MAKRSNSNQKQQNKSDLLVPPFDDRLKRVVEGDSTNTPGADSAPNFVLARLRVPVKPNMEENLDQPEGGGTNCSCNSVCACVPVKTCACYPVCTCDTITIETVSPPPPPPCSSKPIVWWMPCGW